ncbi:hypothetical protein B0H19DRAFT_1365184 [Mycena capillaripes]|nr:hypothetical protein B0H19DRAFT_1365184 [Mycena capillaripes]
MSSNHPEQSVPFMYRAPSTFEVDDNNAIGHERRLHLRSTKLGPFLSNLIAAWGFVAVVQSRGFISWLSMEARNGNGLSIAVVVLTGLQMAGWADLITPAVIISGAALSGHELDLSSRNLRQLQTAAYLIQVRPGALVAFLVGQTESGYASVKSHLNIPAAFMLIDQTLNISTALVFVGSGLYGFMRTTVYQFLPKITNVRVDYSDSNSFSSIIGTVTLLNGAAPDIAGPADLSAATTIWNMVGFAQAATTNIMENQLRIVLRELDVLNETILSLTENYMHGVEDYSGSVFRACLSSKNGTFPDGVPSNMSIRTDGPPQPDSIASLCIVLRTIARYEGDHVTQSFDPSNSMHLVSAAASGGPNNVFTGTEDAEIRAAEGVNVVLGTIDGRRPALKTTYERRLVMSDGIAAEATSILGHMVYFIFKNRITMRSLSRLAILAVFLVLTTSADVGVQPSPDAGTIFAVYPGWDMDNGALQTILNGTEISCLESCRSSATCVAYSYVPYGNSGTGITPFCVLKSSVDLGAFKMQSFDVSVGLVGACGTFNPVGPTSCRTVMG